MNKDPIGEFYRTDWSVERKPTTHPEHDDAIDAQAIDIHARKLEQEKVSRDVQRFLDLRVALVGISLGR